MANIRLVVKVRNLLNLNLTTVNVIRIVLLAIRIYFSNSQQLVENGRLCLSYSGPALSSDGHSESF
jgi:hypothetical protein